MRPPLTSLTCCTQANTLAPYLSAIRSSLDSALCLPQLPSQTVERHNKPEVELQYVGRLAAHLTFYEEDIGR